jgi:putative endonuclease
MFSGSTVRATVRVLDWLAERVLPPPDIPVHLRIGQRGELAAYFYLRRLGYIIVARNYRSPRCRGEIDLIAWDGEVLCFIEVKTRTSRAVKPAEAAVDYEKRRELVAVAREYMRGLPTNGQWRFDVVSIYYEGEGGGHPEIELFRNAFPVS